MREASFKSRRAKLVICTDNGYLWIYRGKAKPTGRVTCPDCKRKYRLQEIMLVKKRRAVAE